MFFVITFFFAKIFVSPSLRALNFAQKTWDLSGYRSKLQNYDKRADFSRHFLSFCNQFAIFWSTSLLSRTVVKVLGYDFAASFMRSSQVIENHFLRSGSRQSGLQTHLFLTIEIYNCFLLTGSLSFLLVLIYLQVMMRSH